MQNDTVSFENVESTKLEPFHRKSLFNLLSFISNLIPSSLKIDVGLKRLRKRMFREQRLRLAWNKSGKKLTRLILQRNKLKDSESFDSDQWTKRRQRLARFRERILKISQGRSPFGDSNLESS